MSLVAAVQSWSTSRHRQHHHNHHHAAVAEVEGVDGPGSAPLYRTPKSASRFSLQSLAKRLRAKQAPHWSVNEDPHFVARVKDLKGLLMGCDKLLKSAEDMRRAYNMLKEATDDVQRSCTAIEHTEQGSRFGYACDRAGRFVTALTDKSVEGFLAIHRAALFEPIRDMLRAQFEMTKRKKDAFRFAKARYYYKCQDLEKLQKRSSANTDRVKVAEFAKSEARQELMECRVELQRCLDHLFQEKNGSVSDQILRITEIASDHFRSTYFSQAAAAALPQSHSASPLPGGFDASAPSPSDYMSPVPADRRFTDRLAPMVNGGGGGGQYTPRHEQYSRAKLSEMETDTDHEMEVSGDRDMSGDVGNLGEENVQLQSNYEEEAMSVPTVNVDLREPPMRAQYVPPPMRSLSARRSAPPMLDVKERPAAARSPFRRPKPPVHSPPERPKSFGGRSPVGRNSVGGRSPMVRHQQRMSSPAAHRYVPPSPYRQRR